MSQDLWSAVDHYFTDALIPDEHALAAALAAGLAANLPPINVSLLQGALLRLLAQMQSARRILEIGTLGGYSTLWLAGALPPDGKIVTLEFEQRHAAVANRNFAAAGLADRIELRLGPAIDSLHVLIAERAEPFDLIFIDADKINIPRYFEASLKLSRSGTLIIVDNIVRKGAVTDASNTDPSVIGVRAFVEQLRHEKRVIATAVQTVGSKGYDGFALARVK